MKRSNDQSKNLSFDPDRIKPQFDSALPKVITEIADLLEQPVPHLKKRDHREISQQFYRGIDVSAPHVKVLEEINGDPTRLVESYENLEQIFRKQFRLANIRLRSNEDAFDCFVRQSARLLRAPYPLKRLKQFSKVREGVQILVRTAMGVNGGFKTSEELIQEFGRKHFKEYMRFANTVDARFKSYANIDFRKVTNRNISRISDVYRDTAAAFENRLRLLVGLNFIAVGKGKSYSQLRDFGYNQLLQAVESPKYPLLHFLGGAVNRNIRNALSHAGVSSRLSKKAIVFVDYSPSRKKEIELVWTMSKFMRETNKLLLTVLGAAYAENEFTYVRTYCMVEAMKEMVSAQRNGPRPQAGS